MDKLLICGQVFEFEIVADYYAFELVLVLIHTAKGSGVFMTYEELQGYQDAYSSMEQSER